MKKNNICSKVINKLNEINNSYKKRFNKSLKILPNNLWLMIFFIILLAIFIPKIINNDIIKYKTSNPDGFMDEIVYKVEQKINVDNIDNIDELGILFATYKRKNNSNYKLEVLKNNEVIYKKRFNARILKDNSYEYFKLNLKKIDSKSEYKYVLTPLNVKKGNGITITTNKKNEAVYSIKNKSEFYNICIILSVTFLIIFFIFNYLINVGIIKTEKRFLLMMLVYIIPILFIYPAFETPDEPFHFYKSTRLSQYDFNKTQYENLSKKKINLPKNYWCLTYSGIQEYESVKNKKDFYDCFKSASNQKMKLPSVVTNNLLVYIPSALGIKIMDVFTNSPMLIFYTGRVFNLLVSFLILLLALKTIPKHKKTFLLIVCIPMFIQQMISYSYDSILNSLCILIVSYLIKFYNSKDTIRKKDLIIYFITSILILNIKMPYVLLALPILFVNKEKFGSKKYSKLLSCLIFLILLIATNYIFKYFSNIGIENINTGSHNNGIGNTLESLIFHPGHLIFVIYSTIVNNMNDYLNSMIGIFGWLTIKLNQLLIVSYYAFMILVALSDNSKIKIKERIINLLAIIAIIVGIFLAMYLYWTPTGNLIIDGVQGRYFLPLLLMIIIMLLPRKRKMKLEDKTIYNFINISTLFYIITLIVSFY